MGDCLIAFDLVACLDESGIHDDARICIMSGYIGSIRNWSIFEERWERVLQRFDVADFHSKAFFAVDESGQQCGSYRTSSDRSRKGTYAHWTADKAGAFLDGLLDVIQGTDVRPIGAYIDTAVFWERSYGERRFLTGGFFDFTHLKWKTSGAPTKPYFLIFDHCVAEAALQTKPGLKTLFLFDQQKQFEGRAVQQFMDSASALSRADSLGIGKRIGGILFHERLDVPGLQAADLYTHCWYRYVTKPADKGLRFRALDRMTAKVPGMKFYTREHIQGLFDKLPARVAVALRECPEDAR